MYCYKIIASQTDRYLRTNRLTDFVEIPSLEEIEEMDRQRKQAVESLEISDDSSSVKCQKCGNAVPIVGRMDRKSSKIEALKNHLGYLENHRHYISRANKSNDNDNYSESAVVKEIKAELEELLREDAKQDKLRSLPLYSSKITAFRYVCGPCFENVYKVKRRS